MLLSGDCPSHAAIVSQARLHASAHNHCHVVAKGTRVKNLDDKNSVVISTWAQSTVGQICDFPPVTRDILETLQNCDVVITVEVEWEEVVCVPHQTLLVMLNDPNYTPDHPCLYIFTVLPCL